MKPILALFLTLAMLFPLALYASAADTPAAVLAMEKDGEALLDRLLTRQFDAFCAGKNVYTADILAETEETLLYREYLWWDSERTRRCDSLWDRYEYSLSFVRAEGNTLQYAADLYYWFPNEEQTYGQSDLLYIITLNPTHGNQRITAIDTNEANYQHFKTDYERAVSLDIIPSARGITEYLIQCSMLGYLYDNKELTPKEAAKILLDVALQDEYSSRCTGMPADWDFLFIDTMETARYRAYLWETASSFLNGNYAQWYGYRYDITEDATEDNQFHVVRRYWCDSSPHPESEEINYQITAVKTENGYRINELSSSDWVNIFFYMRFYDVLGSTVSSFDEITDEFVWEASKAKIQSMKEYYYAHTDALPLDMPKLDKNDYALLRNTVESSMLPTTANAGNILAVTEQYLRELLIRACDARCGILPFSADGILKGQKTHDYAAYLADDIQKCQKRGDWAFYNIDTRLVSIGNDGVGFDVTIEYWSRDSYLPMERNSFTIWLNTAYTEEEFYIREIRSDEPGYLAYLQKEDTQPYRELPLPHVPWFCAPVPQKLLHGSVSA